MKGALLALSTLCVAAGPCEAGKLPGDPVGTYHVDGKLIDNSCGSTALPAQDPLSFDVEIRQDTAGRGIWLRPMTPNRFGTLDASGAFQFQVDSSYPIDLSKAQNADDPWLASDPDLLRDPQYYAKADGTTKQTCTLTTTERITGTLLRDERSADERAADAGMNGAADLTGKIEVSVRAAAGSHCGPVLSVNGGPFEQLPCAAHYDLTGKLSGP